MNGTRMCLTHSAGGFYDIKMKFSTVIKNIPGYVRAYLGMLRKRG